MGLEEQVTQYCEQKEQESILSKSNKKLNDEIKRTLIESNQKDATFGKYTVKLESRTSENVDDVKMLAVLKAFWESEHKGEKCPFIATVEVLNPDALEEFMYKTELPESVILDLDKCRTVTTTTALKYSIKKEK